MKKVIEFFSDKLNRVATIGVVVIIVLILLLAKCGSKKSNLDSALTSLDSLKMEFTVKHAKDSSIIAEQALLIVDKDNAMIKQIEKFEKLSKVKAKISTITVTKIDSVLIPIEKPIVITIVDSLNDSTKYLKTPADFEVSKPDYSIKGTITDSSVLVKSILIPDTSTIIIGDKSTGLFKRQSIVRIKHSNPFIQQSSMNNVVVKDDKINKPVVGFIIGGATGIVAATIVNVLVNSLKPR